MQRSEPVALADKPEQSRNGSGECCVAAALLLSLRLPRLSFNLHFIGSPHGTRFSFVRYTSSGIFVVRLSVLFFIYGHLAFCAFGQ